MLRGARRTGAPAWAAALQAADRWHIPPWEVWRAPGAVRWLNRARVYDEEARAAREGAAPPDPDTANPADPFAAASGGIPYVVQASED